jgi:ClpP class serine protease
MTFSFFDMFWLLFIIASIIPLFKQRQVGRNRFQILRKLELMRGSRVISLIHRQEGLSFLGIPITRYINVEDSEQVLRAIRLTEDSLPIDLILHTPGGLVLAAEQIANALKKHPAKVTVFVPHYAMSGGTMIALASDEIIMDENAVLGPVDPQLGEYPAASILRAVEEKDKNKLDDRTLIVADIARKALRQVEETVYELIQDKLTEERAREVARILTEGRWTHDYPITCDFLRELGLPVQVGLPRAVYELMELYPQPPQRRPSVQYVPVPYSRGDLERKGRDRY